MKEAKFAIAILVVGMLVTGTINTVVKKLGYVTCSEGLDGVTGSSKSSDGCPAGQRKFEKPWTQTLVMFLGEAVCMALFGYRAWKKKQEEKVIGVQANAHPITPSSAIVCLVPALCDLAGTTLSGIGLLFTPASVFQMLRGSIIIFTAIFSILFLKRKVHGYQWLGIAITVVGIVLVGTSSYIRSSSSSSDTSTTLVMVGNLLVIMSQTLSAFQMVVEEKYLKKRNLPPEFVVGCEGIFGCVIMIAVILPIVYFVPFSKCESDWCQDGQGLNEDALDAAVMIGNSTLLIVLTILYWISIAFYNFCGLSVSKKLTSVHRTLIDACRTLFVWIVNIIIFYASGQGQYGEEWQTEAGMIQLLGFVLMVLGTLVHNKVIKITRFFDYGAAEPTPMVENPALKESPAQTTSFLVVPLLQSRSDVLDEK